MSTEKVVCIYVLAHIVISGNDESCDDRELATTNYDWFYLCIPEQCWTPFIIAHKPTNLFEPRHTRLAPSPGFCVCVLSGTIYTLGCCCSHWSAGLFWLCFFLFALYPFAALALSRGYCQTEPGERRSHQGGTRGSEHRLCQV